MTSKAENNEPFVWVWLPESKSQSSPVVLSILLQIVLGRFDL